MILSNFIHFVENHFKSCVKTIRTDNGTEFQNHSCQNLFAELGILHQKTFPYTPQQNGVAERKYRHLLQVTRALLFQYGLPKRFWGEALLYATFLINRLLTRILSGKTPFEMLFNKAPDYSLLKVFGCLCFATNTIPQKDKLASRATSCIFVGYQAGVKACKVYNIVTKKIMLTRDVVFHEFIFLKICSFPVYSY